MKLIQLHEKAIDVKADLQYVKDQLKLIKPQLVDRDVKFPRMLEILNDSFRPFGIQFERSSKNFTTDLDPGNDQHVVGLDGGGFDPSAHTITVYVMRNLSEVLADNYQFNSFADVFLVLIGHELIHRHQAERSRVALKDNDPTKMEEYLSQKEEIMAYAHQAAHELVVAFGKEAAQKLLGDLKKVTPWSSALSLYFHHFDYDSSVRKRFLKYVTEYLS